MSRANGAVLFTGEVAALAKVRDALKSHGLDNPIVQECVAELCELASGAGLARHAAVRYRAICKLIDILHGTAREAEAFVPGANGATGNLAFVYEGIEGVEMPESLLGKGHTRPVVEESGSVDDSGSVSESEA